MNRGELEEDRTLNLEPRTPNCRRGRGSFAVRRSMFDVRCSPTFLLLYIACTCLAFLAPAFGAERFNDVFVTPQSVVSGETHHGYREFRILVENLSGKA